MEVNSEDTAQDVAKRTAGLLSTQGYCLWRCAALGGEIIMVVRGAGSDPADPALSSYIRYTVEELQKLLVGDEPTIRLVHQAKKQGAVIE